MKKSCACKLTNESGDRSSVRQAMWYGIESDWRELAEDIGV